MLFNCINLLNTYMSFFFANACFLNHFYLMLVCLFICMLERPDFTLQSTPTIPSTGDNLQETGLPTYSIAPSFQVLSLNEHSDSKFNHINFSPSSSSSTPPNSPKFSQRNISVISHRKNEAENFNDSDAFITHLSNDIISKTLSYPQALPRKRFLPKKLPMTIGKNMMDESRMSSNSTESCYKLNRSIHFSDNFPGSTIHLAPTKTSFDGSSYHNIGLTDNFDGTQNNKSFATYTDIKSLQSQQISSQSNNEEDSTERCNSPKSSSTKNLQYTGHENSGELHAINKSTAPLSNAQNSLQSQGGPFQAIFDPNFSLLSVPSMEGRL